MKSNKEQLRDLLRAMSPEEIGETIKEFIGTKQTIGWKPEIGEKYYYLSVGSIVSCYDYKEDDIDKGILKLGNCFQTEEQAKIYKHWKVSKAQKQYASIIQEAIIRGEDGLSEDTYIFYGDNKWKYVTLGNKINVEEFLMSKQTAKEICEILNGGGE